MKPLRCKVCKNTDPGKYVEDMRTAEITCTCCGCVQTSVNTSYGNVTFCEPLASVAPTPTQQKLLRLNEQMLIKMCPGEYRDHKRDELIDDFCEKLDLSSSVANRTKRLIDNHKEELSHIRPKQNLIAACIIITCQSIKRYINVVDIETMYMLTNVNNTLKHVCKIIGINQRTIILNSVPHMISALSLPFKCERKLVDLYKMVCRKNPSMGSETRMALCCYKVYIENIDMARFKGFELDFIAKLTNTSENSLKTYISGKTPNCLFSKQKKTTTGSAKRSAPSTIENPKSSRKIKLI